MQVYQKRIKKTEDCRLVDERGEDLGRVNDAGQIVYPDETALELVRGVYALSNAREQVVSLQKELRQYRMKPVDLKPLDLTSLTRDSDKVFTHVQLEDFNLREALTTTDGEGDKTSHNWLEFGQGGIQVNDRTGVALLGGRMRDGVTDFEHDSCYVVYIKLVGVTWKFMECNVSYFDAHITPDPSEIRIYDPSFKPEETEGAWQCEDCEDHHWMLPDGHFTPETSDLCRLVAGKRVTIIMGPRCD